MAREAALIVQWGYPARGREGKALEVFNEFMAYWGKQAADGKVAPFEVYFNSDGSEAIAIVRGKSDALLSIVESQEYERLLNKGHMIVEGLRAHLYYGGSEEQITRGIRLSSEAGSELGYM